MATQKKKGRDYPLSETPAPYAYQAGPRIDTEKKLKPKDKIVANVYKQNPNAYASVDESVERVAQANRDKINATLRGDKEAAQNAKDAQESKNEQLKFRNKQSKRWGD